MKKILITITVILLSLTLIGCTNEETKEKEETNAKSSWKNAEVKEYELEDFNTLTNNAPEPKTNYKINSISTVYGLSFDLENEEKANEYLELIKDNNYKFREEIYGIEIYENKTHEIRFSGYSITIRLKD